MKRIIFVTISLLLSYASLCAQDETTYVDPKDTKAAQSYMKEDVSLRKFDKEKWKEVVGDLTYDEKSRKQKDARQPRSWNFPGLAISPGLLQTISFIVVFILFAFILYDGSKNTSLSQSIKNMKQADVSGPLENIEELDTEGLLRQALANGDLRLAVRVHYLLLLKKLNEVGLIAWKKDKTNRDYLSELYGRNSCYDDVRSLTLAYEMVWYGERNVSSDSFQRLSGEFESVNRQITQVKFNA